MAKKKLALLGTNGIPANYGGAETLYEYLTRELSSVYDITVYCSNRQPRKEVGDTFLGAKLKYWPMSANGLQAIPYDVLSIIHAAIHSDVLIVFGFGSGWFVSLLRFFGFRKKVIYNHGGLNEWEREKNSKIGNVYSKWDRKVSRNKVIHVADNELLATSLFNTFGIKNANVIRYGGDQATPVTPDVGLLEKYPFLSEDYYVAVARAQVDNNLHIMLEAFVQMPSKKLVLVSNFKVSEYGRTLYEQYKDKYPNIVLIPGIYDKRELNAVRSNAKAYIHSHSRCGTPPSLCEAMYLGLPIISFDAEVNHEVTNEFAYFFKTADDLAQIVCDVPDMDLMEMAIKSKHFADENYTWARIGQRYSAIIEGKNE